MKDFSERFSRHLVLESFGEPAQNKISKAEVFVAGVGGLGCGVLPYLAAGGVENFTLADSGLVESSNLQRQIMYKEEDQGLEKISKAAVFIKNISSNINVKEVSEYITNSNIDKYLLPEYDLVLDCTDDFTSRFMLADFCWQHKIPLVSAAVLGWEGHIMSMLNAPGNPCYRCLISSPPAHQLKAVEVGVLGAAVGVMGSLQAVEAMKILAGVEGTLEKDFLSFDFKKMRIKKMRRAVRAECSCCSAG